LITNDPDASARFPTDAYAKRSPGSQSYQGPFSVEPWVETGRVHGERSIFSTRAAGDFSFDMKLSSLVQGRGIRVDVGDGASQWFLTQTIPFAWRANTRYAIVAVATMKWMTVYVNGSRIGSIRYQTPRATCRS
jgi:hypothetical protein